MSSGKTLKSLNQQNAERVEARRRMYESHPNGLACPKCGGELWDSNPLRILATNPPQLDIHCPAEGCGWKGYRVA